MAERMLKIKQAVIVEGKYDKIKLSSIIDAVILETNGFGIYKDKEKQKLIRKLADTCGILIITDSDFAGFQIRSFICGSVQSENVFHAYIPDISGKEKRKTVLSKEGKIGVEGLSTSVIMEAVLKAGITLEEVTEPSRRITQTDFYEDGISGGKNSRALKTSLLKQIDLPARLSTNSLLKIINLFMTYDEYKFAVQVCRSEEGEKI